MDKIKVTLPAQIDKIQTMADGSVKLNVITQELPPEEATVLFSLRNKYGWLLFSEAELEQIDIPDEPPTEFKNDKSPSQRLRAVLYVYWEQNTSKKTPFDTYWKAYVEKRINEIKENLA